MNQALVSQRFLELVEIMDTLREKCPWDQKQTIHSLRSNTIEELYELVDSIVEEDWDGIKEELGDIMLHVLFYAKIGNEKGKFTLDEVMEGIAKKLIHRHPHIYGDVKVNNDEDVKRNWEQLKLQEGKGDKTILSGVPNSLPAMVKAIPGSSAMVCPPDVMVPVPESTTKDCWIPVSSPSIGRAFAPGSSWAKLTAVARVNTAPVRVGCSGSGPSSVVSMSRK